MRSGSVSAAQLGDGIQHSSQHSFVCGHVIVNERIRAEDSRNFCSVAVLLDDPHGEAVYVCLRKRRQSCSA